MYAFFNVYIFVILVLSFFTLCAMKKKITTNWSSQPWFIHYFLFKCDLNNFLAMKTTYLFRTPKCCAAQEIIKKALLFNLTI